MSKQYMMIGLIQGDDEPDVYEFPNEFEILDAWLRTWLALPNGPDDLLICHGILENGNDEPVFQIVSPPEYDLNCPECEVGQ